MDDGLKNLVFLVVALLAWGIKAALERKQGRRRSGGPHRSEDATSLPSEPSTGEIDVVYGRRRLPPQIVAAPSLPTGGWPSQAGPAQRRPDSSETAAHDPARVEGRVGTGISGGKPLTQIHKRTLKTTLRATGPQEANEGTGVRRAERAWRRLGVDRARGARRALRTAVLWREVLGPPRALRGPHRPPRRSRRP